MSIRLVKARLMASTAMRWLKAFAPVAIAATAALALLMETLWERPLRAALESRVARRAVEAAAYGYGCVVLAVNALLTLLAPLAVLAAVRPELEAALLSGMSGGRYSNLSDVPVPGLLPAAVPAASTSS